MPDLRADLADLHADSYGWALACCGRDPEQAQEVLQRAYVRILDGRARFRGTASFKTFVFGVIRMVAREERRSTSELSLATSSTHEPVDAAPLPDAEAAAEEQRIRLLKALANLSARQREILELVFYHEMTIEDAAHVMGVGIGSARTHYERGKARLRTLLGVEMMEEWTTI